MLETFFTANPERLSITLFKARKENPCLFSNIVHISSDLIIIFYCVPVADPRTTINEMSFLITQNNLCLILLVLQAYISFHLYLCFLKEPLVDKYSDGGQS